MGNCQTVDAAEMVLLEHPEKGGKVKKIYWPISATEVMSSNPGYYVTLVVQQPGGPGQLRLLRPDDTLHIGHVYRLISFEDVIKEYTLKKAGNGGKSHDGNKDLGGLGPGNDNNDQTGRHESGSRAVGRKNGGRGQWRPALQSIAEL